jgi:CRISPR/Cas system-associated exonuclease Cas4 (RecB family)
MESLKSLTVYAILEKQILMQTNLFDLKLEENKSKKAGVISINPSSYQKASRSKIELYTNCPRCFYFDMNRGIVRPPGFPFTLNNAVDTLLKKEFDVHRVKGTKHPLMEKYGINAVPLRDEHLKEWQENFKGIRYKYEPAHFEVTGAVDDIWLNAKGELMVVDYKATSTTRKIDLDDGQNYHEGYKRQMEVYQWLLRKNSYKVSDTGYFVYCNGLKDKQAFDAKLEFAIEIISYSGNDNWVEKTLQEMRKCLERETPPPQNKDCEYCTYANRIKNSV